jgi:hypothetical protein
MIFPAMVGQYNFSCHSSFINVKGQYTVTLVMQILSIMSSFQELTIIWVIVAAKNVGFALSCMLWPEDAWIDQH